MPKTEEKPKKGSVRVLKDCFPYENDVQIFIRAVQRFNGRTWKDVPKNEEDSITAGEITSIHLRGRVSSYDLE